MTPSPNKSWSDLGRFWTVPNVLSMMRLVIILPVFWLIMQDGPLWWIMMLVLLAIATDYFDGRVARWSHSVSDWGKVLDPLADKIGGGMVVAALVFNGSLPYWFLAVLATRDLCILAGGALLKQRTGRIVLSLWSGKVAVTGVAITSLAALLKPAGSGILYLGYRSAFGLFIFPILHSIFLVAEGRTGSCLS